MNLEMFRRVGALILVSFALLTLSLAATQSLTGIVSDDMCKQKHMMPGHGDADCTHACAKAGSKYALVVGDRIYVLKGDLKQISQFAGMRVSIIGEVTKDSLAVQSISRQE